MHTTQGLGVEYRCKSKHFACKVKTPESCKNSSTAVNRTMELFFNGSSIQTHTTKEPKNLNEFKNKKDSQIKSSSSFA